MGAINISSVGKIYPNGTRALEDVNIEINDGEFVVLVGPSGCGKTTLLRMVAGLEDITEGEISIADKLVNEVAPKDRDIAMVFQNYALYPHMSVYDNMAFSLKLRKLPKDEIESTVSEVINYIDQILSNTPLSKLLLNPISQNNIKEKEIKQITQNSKSKSGMSEKFFLLLFNDCDIKIENIDKTILKILKLPDKVEICIKKL